MEALIIVAERGSRLQAAVKDEPKPLIKLLGFSPASYEPDEKVIFTCGFIYETGFAKESDKSDRYNIGVFYQLLMSISIFK